MATPWIKIEHTTPDKPEIDTISELLGIHPDQALGVLIRLWIWADQQIRKTNALSVSKNAIDRRAGVKGFADAMVLTGWLKCEVDDLVFVNFDRHNGQTAKQRALTAKRVGKHANANTNAQSVSKALTELELELDSKKEKVEKEKACQAMIQTGKRKGEICGSPAKGLVAGEPRCGTHGATEEYSFEFEEFWEAYPKREGKGDAWKAWPKALGLAAKSSKRTDGESPGVFLVRRARDFAAFTATKDRDYIRLPATWLNGGNWDDEMGSRVATAEDMKGWVPQ